MKINKNKKLKKKLLVFGLLGLFAISIISAVAYYSLFTASFNVIPSVVIEGDLEQELAPTYAGEEIRGSAVDITNDAPTERTISITDDGGVNVAVSYVANLNVAQKNVDFELDVWTILEEGDTAVIEYVVVGDEFTAEVVDGEQEDYVLVYYKDNSDRFNSPATAIGIEEVVGNLAYEDDKNNDEYDYCETEEYVTCHGAKIWYLPSDMVDSEGNVDWSKAGEVLFETELIQYNADGQIVLYPGQTLTITPIYVVDDYAPEGEYIVTTEVA